MATPVLHAISALSAAHWASYTTDRHAREDVLRLEAQSRAACIHAIQEEIGSRTDNVRPTVVMAFSLLLYLSALYYELVDDADHLIPDKTTERPLLWCSGSSLTRG